MYQFLKFRVLLLLRYDSWNTEHIPVTASMPAFTRCAWCFIIPSPSCSWHVFRSHFKFKFDQNASDWAILYGGIFSTFCSTEDFKPHSPSWRTHVWGLPQGRDRPNSQNWWSTMPSSEWWFPSTRVRLHVRHNVIRTSCGAVVHTSKNKNKHT